MDEETAEWLTRIEQKLDWIAARIGEQPDVGYQQPGGGLTAEEQMLASSGRLIQAIKVYRQRTGVGLKQAKDDVERLSGRR